MNKPIGIEELEKQYMQFIAETTVIKSFTNGLKQALKLNKGQIEAMVKINEKAIKQREKTIQEILNK